MQKSDKSQTVFMSQITSKVSILHTAPKDNVQTERKESILKQSSYYYKSMYTH